MADYPLGYYVHHHGSGHMQRALQICSHIARPVVLFSSRRPELPLPGNVSYVQLPSDIVDEYVPPPAGQPFHYTPQSPLIAARSKVLVDAICQYDIRSMYVDVSMEIVVLCKLLGLYVGTAVMHGQRSDPAHTLGYTVADYRLWHNAANFDTPANRQTGLTVEYSGGISRYRKQRLYSRNEGVTAPVRNIVVTTSPASSQLERSDIEATAKAFPDIVWRVIGTAWQSSGLSNLAYEGVVDDPMSYYTTADLVVGSAGNNTIMEVAASGKPFVCIPEDRPFAEQTEAATALQRLNAALYVAAWPDAAGWQAIFRDYTQLDLTAFNGLVDDSAAARAAAIIEDHMPS